MEVSDDGENWTTVVPHATGETHARLNLASPAESRFVRLTITEKNGWQQWHIRELNLHGHEG